MKRAVDLKSSKKRPSRLTTGASTVKLLETIKEDGHSSDEEVSPTLKKKHRNSAMIQAKLKDRFHLQPVKDTLELPPPTTGYFATPVKSEATMAVASIDQEFSDLQKKDMFQLGGEKRNILNPVYSFVNPTFLDNLTDRFKVNKRKMPPQLENALKQEMAF
mmetsp:Transcript_20372/g.31104  ORF Transcript_20372/g.31104 Transcript_20372/m.31104 type:complete len:161 (-) Transcript_20372:720-1202(-)